ALRPQGIMTRSRFMLLLGVDPVRWSTRYDIEPFSHPCDTCGTLLTTSIPFAFESLRGLVAPTCRCGNDRTPYCLVRKASSGDLFTDKATLDPTASTSKRSSDQVYRPWLRVCS